MSNILKSLVALSVAFAGVSAYPSHLESRASTGNFSLFAYGSNTDTEIGGYPIFWNGGYAFIANPAKVNYTASYVEFAKGTDDTTSWIANPLTTTNVNWTSSLFYIPTTYGPIGFYKEGVSNVSTDDIITTGFKLYGSTAMISVDGTLATDWYAVSTSIDGLWSVGWNATGGGVTDAELISLRKGQPVNVDYPKNR